MNVYLIGTSCTQFGKKPNTSFKELTREAYTAALADAGLDDGDRIDSSWFANVKMEMYGQPNIRGQVCFSELTEEGLFPKLTPMTNVEAACASGSVAMLGAFRDIASGTSDIALAIGVEKTFIPDDPARQYELFTGGIDLFDRDVWQSYYDEIGRNLKNPFQFNKAGGSLNMDTYAIQANYHMETYGTTQRQLAIAASKTHGYGALNPRAQYQFEVSVDDVMNDRPVSFPLTRSMCAPIGDGAAAALLCSEAALASLPAEVADRAVKVLSAEMVNGRYRKPTEPGVSHYAAKRAYAAAGVTPDDIDLAEVHDATSFGEIYKPETLGFCEFGKGGKLVEAGETMLGGKIPINLSGGLISKGHPVGATGLSMVYELTSQLRGEAGERQVENAHIALAENGGGTMGFDDAVCNVTILQRR